MNKENKIVIFQDNKIRRIFKEGKWWFSIIDVIYALTQSSDPKQYVKKMRQRDFELNAKWGTICTPVKMLSPDGRAHDTNAADTESLFRIIQSIPSKKAEPFKRWLAKVGYERIQEIENPELAQERAKKYYELKGYSQDWIDKRLRSIAVRQKLTEEWDERGIEKGKEYAILTNEIAKATFGISVKEHKKVKNLNPKFNNQNLRDHMNDLELIFTMLGEAATTEIVQEKDARVFKENKKAAKEGGDVAGNARKELEKKSGKKVVSKSNFLMKKLK